MSKPKLTEKKYSHYDTWKIACAKKPFDLHDNTVLESWNPMFEELDNEKLFDKINKQLNNCVQEKNDLIMHPAPNLVLNAFALTDLNNLKVVFIGQDPYFDHTIYHKRIVSQATGLAFSVPYGTKIPSSLANIYNNLFTNGNIKEKPTHGNLEYWASQGCLFLNTALTVLDGSANKNCHKNMWKKFTDHIIRYISHNCDKIVFVAWGASAYEKLSLVDMDKHDGIISSHPSGLSAGKPLQNYPPFNNYDHFGQINTILRKWNKEPINWNLYIEKKTIHKDK